MIDYSSVGKKIFELRTGGGLTQKELADSLHISPKTVSKWETGQGCPDIGLLMDLCAYFNVKVEDIIGSDTGVALTQQGVNLRKSTFYVCPFCGNVVVSSGCAEVRCCGRKLEGLVAMSAKKASEELPDFWDMDVEVADDEWYITTEHPMRKDQYVSFVAMVTPDRVQLVKLYPEWDVHLRFPRYGHGELFWYSTENGLIFKRI